MDTTFRRPTRSLAGKVAIVTGAGAQGDGLGNARASAILLAEDGCAVVCVDRDLPLAQRTVEMIESEGKGKGLAVQADVAVAADCERVVKETVGAYGRVDILFNCVGVGGPKGTALEVDMEGWAKGMQINVGSMVLMAKYAIPEMVKNDPAMGYRGSIVNQGSVAGLRGGNPALLYPVSKGAIVQMTKAMAFHHAKQGIRVNCVCPGMVYTPMIYGGGMSEEAREARKERSLLKTEGNAWDTASAVRFLAGDEGRWLTGVILQVDAGAIVAVGTDLPESTSSFVGAN